MVGGFLLSLTLRRCGSNLISFRLFSSFNTFGTFFKDRVRGPCRIDYRGALAIWCHRSRNRCGKSSHETPRVSQALVTAFFREADASCVCLCVGSFVSVWRWIFFLFLVSTDGPHSYSPPPRSLGVPETRFVITSKKWYRLPRSCTVCFGWILAFLVEISTGTSRHGITHTIYMGSSHRYQVVQKRPTTVMRGIVVFFVSTGFDLLAKHVVRDNVFVETLPKSNAHS